VNVDNNVIIEDGKIFYFKNVNSGLFITVPPEYSSTNIFPYQDKGNSDLTAIPINQMLAFGRILDRSGVYVYRAIAGANSDLYSKIGIQENTSSIIYVNDYEDTGNKYLYWKISRNTDGTFRFISMSYYDYNEVLTVGGASKLAGIPLQSTFTNTTGKESCWQLIPVKFKLKPTNTAPANVRDAGNKNGKIIAQLNDKNEEYEVYGSMDSYAPFKNNKINNTDDWWVRLRYKNGNKSDYNYGWVSMQSLNRIIP